MKETKALIRKIHASLSGCLSVHKPSLYQELRRIEASLERTPDEKSRGSAMGRLVRLDRKAAESIAQRDARRAGLPRIDYPPELPITDRRDAIVEAIRRHQVVIVSGDTGSGKSTQIPKMCLEAGRGIRGLIGHTQPRRIAAMTIARRISEEFGKPVGGPVGYKIRFEEKTGPHSYIKVMTDGILLAEVQLDPFLNIYDTIIVDEAHERSLNIDFLLGILRSLLKKRRDLKLIITSATLDTKKFSEAFGNAPVIEVSGRLYPVELRYRPFDSEAEEVTYIDAARRAVEEIELESSQGDILIFMPTEQDIRETCAVLAGRHKGRDSDTVLPLFARLTWAEQRRIFAPSPFRKIIVATNVAETSLTIPGIRYVIDTGLARIAQYNTRTRTLNLPVTTVSRSSADQRKGRCGRVAAGVCIRLYDAADYEAWPLYTPPEILRSNLAEVILRMLSLRIGDIESFPFIDPPEARNIRNGLEALIELDAVQADEAAARAGRTDAGRKDARQDGKMRYVLTDLGRQMARLPVDPRISRMILEAGKEGCIRDVAVIASALSIQDPREWPFDQLEAARKAHEPFLDPSSDFMTFLNIWSRYHAHHSEPKSQSRIRKFCRSNFLSYRRMREWIDIHDQLTAILTESGSLPKDAEQSAYPGIHKSILSGYLSNIAVRKEKNVYAAARGREVMLFPGSGLFNRGGEWIMAAEMVETTRLYARTAAVIDREWLEPLAKDLCRYSYADARWQRKRGEVVASEQVTLFGLVIVAGRPVSYGRIAPDEASAIFIRSALVEGDLEKFPRFLERNQSLIEKIANMEDKLRRRDLLVSDEDLFAFYAERLPGVYDIRTLQKLIRDSGGDDFLLLREEDLLRRAPDRDELSQYPDRTALGKLAYSLQYRFNPGSQEDGLTAAVPYGLVGAVSAPAADWLVPGLQREKLAFLIKALPKEFRKRLVPVPETVETILGEMPRQEDAPLASALSDFILKRFGVDIPARAWPMDALPDHLKMRFSITDGKGREIRSGRDIGELKSEISSDVESRAWGKARKKWEREDVTAWDFGDLPESIVLEGPAGMEGLAYPALDEEPSADSAEGSHISIRLFQNREEAQRAHERGVRSLYALYFKKDLQYLKKQPLPGEWKNWAGEIGGEKELRSAIRKRTLLKLSPGVIRMEREFLHHAEQLSGKILLIGLEAAREIMPALQACAGTRGVIWNLEQKHRTNKTALAFLAEIRGRMDAIASRNSIAVCGNDRLAHLPRYLKALEVRAERGLAHLDKDREKAAQVRPYETLAVGLLQSLSSKDTAAKRNAVDEFRWMVEEYQVAVFAQQIKTAFPVSPKRLQEKYKEIERMI